ncbi:MAG: DUF92 domain-containing protein [Candidatus Eisenbacteria bacterium]|uniref:DUF92 domain-containing protein n=1 Tax=Eiseniibacteriota bacterium TaxID=2212470 RepID=A0A948W7I6_UNCEI|nr:DUF92 domain-containing protein [Candidatus Eisenbacteria bacterium]MBU1947520.1 DUF92 domain-containing protein [Candidatus Eisenbacteria bacterium]MBU2691676.1 DUF92 domain-containing protein [Candidatus Eisenbacteria bacterium]
MREVIEAFGVNAVLGTFAFVLRAVRLSGYVGGVLLGSMVYLGAGRQGFGVLLGFFILGTALTRFGYATKEARGVAEEQGGRRGISHTLANGTTGLLLALLMGIARMAGWGGEETQILLKLAFTAAFATAAADTSSSEIGSLWGRHPISLRTFRAVPVGTEGAVSIEGTSAGIAASAVLAVLAWVSGWYGPVGILIVTIAATLGNLGESIAASWGMKSRGHHQLLNFLNTVTGAVLSVLLALLIGRPY